VPRGSLVAVMLTSGEPVLATSRGAVWRRKSNDLLANIARRPDDLLLKKP